MWTGQPKTGIVLRPFDLFVIPFSLFWFGGVLFIFGTTLFANDSPSFLPIFFIPFIAIGSYITFGRFLVDIKRRAGTSYGITEKRIIIKSGLFSKNTQSINIKTLSDISIQEKSNKSGTITFGPEDIRSMMMNNMNIGFGKQASKLETIDDVRNVYNLILKLQHS